MIVSRPTLSALGAMALAVMLAGCSTIGNDKPINTLGKAQPEQLTPLGESSVAQQSLPPLPGQQTVPTYEQPVAPVQTANAAGAPGATRDLSGGLTIEKLLGSWTIISGATQCRLNLTYTTKAGTNRYRASTPGCVITGLGQVASWQVVGNQVQLFDEGGKLVAALARSGNRFVGTSSGGVGISMVG